MVLVLASDDTNGSGKDMYCPESMEEMLCSYDNIYIDVLKRFKVQNPQNRGQWLKKTCIFSYYFLIKKLHFEKLLKGTPVGRLSLPNNVHVHPQLKNTLSPAGHKLISIELLAYPLDLKGNSIESKMISIEILTYPWDIKGNISWTPCLVLLLVIWGWTPSHGSRPSGGEGLLYKNTNSALAG